MTWILSCSLGQVRVWALDVIVGQNKLLFVQGCEWLLTKINENYIVKAASKKLAKVCLNGLPVLKI